MKIKRKKSATVVHGSLFALLLFYFVFGLLYKTTRQQQRDIFYSGAGIKFETIEVSYNENSAIEEEIIVNEESDSEVFYDEEGRPYILRYLGVFDLTGYCPCEQCSEGYDHNTSTGTWAQEGRTLAVDPDEIDYGTHLWIDGQIGIAEDCGGAIQGHHIDVFKVNHADCFNADCNGKHDVYKVIFLDTE